MGIELRWYRYRCAYSAEDTSMQAPIISITWLWAKRGIISNVKVFKARIELSYRRKSKVNSGGLQSNSPRWRYTLNRDSNSCIEVLLFRSVWLHLGIWDRELSIVYDVLWPSVSPFAAPAQHDEPNLKCALTIIRAASKLMVWRTRCVLAFSFS